MIDKVELWWHSDDESTDITALAGELEWSESNDRHSMKLGFKLPDTNEEYLPHYTIAAGDKIELIYKSELTGDTTVYCFVVTDVKREKPERSITAYDFCWYVEKNNVIIQFENISVKSAIEKLCGKLGIAVGEICDMGYVISGVYIDSAESVIEELIEKQKDSDGNEYSYEMRAEKLYVYKLPEDIESYRYKPAENVAEYDVSDIHSEVEYSHSITNMVNSVTAIVKGSTENSLPAMEYTISDTTNIKKYGTLSGKLEVSADKQNEIAVLAKNELNDKNKIKREISTKMQGAVNARVNRVMHICDEYTGLDALFRIKEVTHRYQAGIYTMEVKLEYVKENSTATYEESSVKREDVDLNGSYTTLASESTDARFERLYQVAQKYLGIPYVWGGSTPAQGFDCSGFVCYVLNESGAMSVARTTAQGLYNLTTHVKSPKPGDLCFWYDGASIYHVAIYIGNGKNIQAPQSGEVVSIKKDSGVYCYGRY